MRRFLIPLSAFLLGTALIAGFYFGILIWAQGGDFARDQFFVNRWYILPIWILFGAQAALFSILRFHLFIPVNATAPASYAGAFIGANGATSTTAMLACCLHHVTDVLPILGLSAAATFLTRYQRPFMLSGLGLEIIGVVAMLLVFNRERRRLRLDHKIRTVLEPA